MIIGFGVARKILDVARRLHATNVVHRDLNSFVFNAFEQFKQIQVRFILIPSGFLLQAITTRGGERWNNPNLLAAFYRV